MRIALLVTFALSCAVAAAGPDSAEETRLKADVRFLSSPTLEGRLSMSAGSEIAANYIAAEFERDGLKPIASGGFFQTFPLVQYTSDHAKTRLTLHKTEAVSQFQDGKDFRSGYWKDAFVSGAVVFAGYGITAPEYSYDDFANVDVRGKIVLVFDHEPEEDDRKSIFNGTGHTRHGAAFAKIENAFQHGAIALLLASEPLRKHRGFFDQAKSASETPLRGSAPRQAIEQPSIPMIQVSDQLAAEVLGSTGLSPSELQRAIDRDLTPDSRLVPDTTVELSLVVETAKTGKSVNVIGLLEGCNRELSGDTVVFTAHYDHLGLQNGHLYPGANDNTSGTAAVMELARKFAASAKRTRRSLLFIVFGSEEEGLLGSRYYVSHPLRDLSRTRAVLNLDMIARNEAHIPESRGVVQVPSDTSNTLTLVGTFYSPSLRNAVFAANAKIGLELNTKFDDDHDLNALFRCDHFPFLLHDVPAVWFFGGWHPDYHEPSDSIEKLNFKKFAKVVDLAYESGRAIADSDTPPSFDAGGGQQ